MSVDYSPSEKMWSDVLTKPLQVTVFKEIRYILMKYPVEYTFLCTEDVDNIAGVSKPEYFPITSRLMKPLEKKLGFMASPQEYVGKVPKQ